MQTQRPDPAGAHRRVQATILLFLAAEPVCCAASGDGRGADGSPALDDAAPRARPDRRSRLMDPVILVALLHPGPRSRDAVRRIPGLRRPVDLADHPAVRDADRLRRPLRRHLRAIRRGQHRDRGHHARRRPSRGGRRLLIGRRLPSTLPFGAPPALIVAVIVAIAPASWSRSSMRGSRSRSTPTRSSAAPSSTSSRSG